MRPEDKVVSLETAKKLKELGFPQDTERFYHMSYGGGETTGQLSRGRGHEPFDTEEYNIAAPDAQEIGEFLPFRSKKMNTVNDARLVLWRLPENEWMIWYLDEDTNEEKTPRFYGAEAEARAAAWIYLKENNLI